MVSMKYVVWLHEQYFLLLHFLMGNMQANELVCTKQVLKEQSAIIECCKLSLTRSKNSH